MPVDGDLFGARIMSRITLAVTICVVLTRTAAPCYAELFSVAVPDLEDFYGGFGGASHESEFDFGQDFEFINEAWLHIEGLSEVLTGGASALAIFARLDDVPGPGLELPEAVEFDAIVPLTPADTVLDGNGTVHLTINVLQCCDLGALVTGATLWFDVGTIPACGNGVLDPGEQCDDGVNNSDTLPDACRTNCTEAGCGDGTIDSGEDCDDGNTSSGDGCSSSCEVEISGTVPTVSTWSLIVLTMLGMAAGTIMIGRHRRPAAA